MNDEKMFEETEPKKTNPFKKAWEGITAHPKETALAVGAVVVAALCGKSAKNSYDKAKEDAANAQNELMYNVGVLDGKCQAYQEMLNGKDDENN